MKQLTNAQRLRVVLEFEKTQNLSATARRTHLNIKTVRRWVSRHSATGGVCTRKGRGRRRALDEVAAQRAVQLLLGGQHSGCHQVALQLHREGLTSTAVHRVTVSRQAKGHASSQGSPITAVMTAPKKLLTADTRRKRLAFCRGRIGSKWGHVMFTDRKRFLFKHPGTRVHKVQWVKHKEARVAHTVNHPMCLNVYAGVTRFGMTRAHMVTGTSKMSTSFRNQKGQASKNITGEEYKQVLLKTLLPEGRRIFSAQGISTWNLQQDNDPSHKRAAAAALEEWNRLQSAVQLLPAWPPNSPDLSPIENIWAWAQHKVDAIGCKNFDDFKHAVLSTLQSVPKQMVNNMFSSMHSRLAACIALQGGKTKY